MFWLLFALLSIVIALIGTVEPSASPGYLVVLAWTMFLIYLVFLRKDEVTRLLEEKNE